MISTRMIDFEDNTSITDMDILGINDPDGSRMLANPNQLGLDFSPGHHYKIRRSKRAKHLRINIHRNTGIEVVIPDRMSLRHVAPFIKQHQQWIDAQVTRLGLDQPAALPESIKLRMTGETWQVEYCLTSSTDYRLRQQNPRLIISGPDRHPQHCRQKLYQWLRKQARKPLHDRLQHLSQLTGLIYGRVSIRTQKTRWGSCSSAGNINLNDRLILLPPELVDYVLIHELAHTREHNHSPAFWKLVAQHCPEYKNHQKHLRQAHQLLPCWV